MRKPTRSGECVQCGECCKKVRITSVLSAVLGDHGSLDEAKKYYSYRGVRVVELDKPSDRVLLEMDVPCAMLGADNRCLVHDDPDKKPLICHKYPWFKDDIESCGYKFK